MDSQSRLCSMLLSPHGLYPAPSYMDSRIFPATLLAMNSQIINTREFKIEQAFPRILCETCPYPSHPGERGLKCSNV